VDGLDLTVYWFPNTSDSFLLPLRRLAYKNAVEIYSISVRSDMCKPAGAARDKEAAELRNWVDVANKLGASHIRVFGGTVPKDATVDQAAGWVTEMLKSASEYANFIFRFEFKLTPGGNNGVGIRAPLEGDIAYTGMEIQILDHNNEQYKGKLQPAQRHGSVYGVIPASSENLKPVGEWNQEEIMADGKHIVVKLNGKTITDGDLGKVTDPEVLKKHPGLLRTSGHIGFLGHGSHVEFRNLQVKELK
jgi:hypothetical protein